MKQVKIVEVGMRDGLQNEKQTLDLQSKLDLADFLVESGLKHIEAGAFVREDKVPQMAGSAELIEKLRERHSKIVFSCLVPNEKGMRSAIEANANEVAIFTAASETFCQKNINCSIQESFDRFVPVMKMAKAKKIKVRGYISTSFGCPFEGSIDPKKTVEVAFRLFKLGCYEISIGDTIGVADPESVVKLFKLLKKKIPIGKLAGHFHDTRGTALANIFASHQLGLNIFDTSIGGLGGCPYAPGATGNVATEDVIYMFDKMKVKTSVNLANLISTNHWLSEKMHKPLFSKVSKAGLPKPINS